MANLSHFISFFIALIYLLVSSQAMEECQVNTTCIANEVFSCPVGYYCNSSSQQCECLKDGHGDINSIIRCNPPELTARILDCYCMTFDNNSITLGACSFNCNPGKPMYSSLATKYSELTQRMCTCNGLNREHKLCGNCKEKHSFSLYSYGIACVKCKLKGWHRSRRVLEYIAVAYLPLTLFVFFVLFFKLNITSSNLHGFVLFCQIISTPAVIRILLNKKTASKSVARGIKALTIIFGISNLDFFRAYTCKICLDIDVLTIAMLDYFIAAFPLFLICLSYIMTKLHQHNVRCVVFIWRPFRWVLFHLKHNWDTTTTIADAYSTFFLLSYMKFLSVSFDLLVPTSVYTFNSNSSLTISKGLVYDPTKRFFGKQHLPYGIISLIVLFIFVILPTVVLFVYQFASFRKMLACLPVNLQMFHASINMIQICFKNGMEPGTRDHRWFSGMFLLLRIVVFISFATTPTYLYFVLSTIYILTFSLIMLFLQPYKKEYSHHLPVNLMFTTLIALVYVSIAGLKIAAVKSLKHRNACYYMAAVFTVAPLAYVSIYTLYWIYSRRRFGLGFVRKANLRLRGYGVLLGEGELEDSLPDRVQTPNRYSYENLPSFATRVLKSE